MATVIRLSRAGAKKRPIYHFVAADSRFPRDGRYIENLGLFNPATDVIDLKGERLDYWLSVGAQPSNTVKNLIKKWKTLQAAAPAPAE